MAYHSVRIGHSNCHLFNLTATVQNSGDESLSQMKGEVLLFEPLIGVVDVSLHLLVPHGEIDVYWVPLPGNQSARMFNLLSGLPTEFQILVSFTKLN